MNKDQSLCTGKKCTQREKCIRFLEGKKSNSVRSWFDGKGRGEEYNECELFIEEE